MKIMEKYRIPKVSESGHFLLQLPKDSKILTVETLRGEPYIWALVDHTKEAEEREFLLLHNGKSVEEENSLTYIGHYSAFGHEIVIHLFEYDQLPSS